MGSIHRDLYQQTIQSKFIEFMPLLNPALDSYITLSSNIIENVQTKKIISGVGQTLHDTSIIILLTNRDESPHTI